MTVGFVGTAELAVLRDGRWVHVRPVRLEDEEQIVQFLRGLSVDAIYSRFFTRCPDLAREASGGCRPYAVGLAAQATPGSCGVVSTGPAQLSRRPQGHEWERHA